jgi:galactoside O-acetyltransferase
VDQLLLSILYSEYYYRCKKSKEMVVYHIMIPNLLKKLILYPNRRNLFRRLGEFSVKNRTLFQAEVVLSGCTQPETCSIFVDEGSLIIGSIHFQRNGAFLRIGRNSFIGASELIISTGITIGNNVLISRGCLLQDHDAHSREAALRRDNLRVLMEGRQHGWARYWTNVKRSPIVIEDDAWIGARAIILKGVTIGHGAIVGAGAVVTRSVSPSATAVGNPAREIG